MELHECSANGCMANVPRERLMCGRHWRMVPRAVQSQVWAAFDPEQLDTLAPSTAWWSAAALAVEAVARAEGRAVENHYRRTFERLTAAEAAEVEP